MMIELLKSTFNLRKFFRQKQMHEIRTTSFEAVKRKLDQIVIGTMHCRCMSMY